MRIKMSELAEIERGLHDRLAAPAGVEAQTDLADFATRQLNKLIVAYRELHSRTNRPNAA